MTQRERPSNPPPGAGGFVLKNLRRERGVGEKRLIESSD